MTGYGRNADVVIKKLKGWGATQIEMPLDYGTGTAIIRFRWGEKDYAFKYKQSNATEAMSKLAWSIARIIDLDIRGILPFQKMGKEFLAISGPPGFESNSTSNPEAKWFLILDSTPQDSNEQIKRQYFKLAGMFHPDRAMKQEDKPYYERKFSEAKQAYEEIKKARGFE